MTERIAVFVEAVRTKAFASALEWPGWSRSARTPEGAIGALLVYAPRYEPVASDAGLVLPASADNNVVEIVETAEGDASTAFGVPGRLSARDRQPMAASEASRRADLVAAAWRRFDLIAAGAPAELRKGPRGGGRDTARIVEHVIGSDHGYTRELDVSVPPPVPTDAAAIAAMREAMLAVLRRPSDGFPIVRRWTTAYAARRIAWHALDHAWEIEDRMER